MSLIEAKSEDYYHSRMAALRSIIEKGVSGRCRAGDWSITYRCGGSAGLSPVFPFGHE